jgi:hypothetical protein
MARRFDEIILEWSRDLGTHYLSFFQRLALAYLNLASIRFRRDFLALRWSMCGF